MLFLSGNYCTHEHAFGEYRRETAGDDRVALMEFRVARQLLEQSLRGVGAVPGERAHVILPLHLARNTQMGIEHRDEARGVVASHVHDSYYTVLIHHSHLGFYAVETPFRDGYVIMVAVYGIVYHVGHYEIVAR